MKRKMAAALILILLIPALSACSSGGEKDAEWKGDSYKGLDYKVKGDWTRRETYRNASDWRYYRYKEYTIAITAKESSGIGGGSDVLQNAIDEIADPSGQEPIKVTKREDNTVDGVPAKTQVYMEVLKEDSNRDEGRDAICKVTAFARDSKVYCAMFVCAQAIFEDNEPDYDQMLESVKIKQESPSEAGQEEKDHYGALQFSMADFAAKLEESGGRVSYFYGGQTDHLMLALSQKYEGASLEDKKIIKAVEKLYAIGGAAKGSETITLTDSKDIAAAVPGREISARITQQLKDRDGEVIQENNTDIKVAAFLHQSKLYIFCFDAGAQGLGPEDSEVYNRFINSIHPI